MKTKTDKNKTYQEIQDEIWNEHMDLVFNENELYVELCVGLQIEPPSDPRKAKRHAERIKRLKQKYAEAKAKLDANEKVGGEYETKKKAWITLLNASRAKHWKN